MGAILSFFEKRLYISAVGMEKYLEGELCVAIRDNKLKQVKKVLPLVDICRIEVSILYYAKRYGAPDIYEYVLANIDVDAIYTSTREAMWMPLIASGLYNNNEMTQILSNSKNINIKNYIGVTILHSMMMQTYNHINTEEMRERIREKNTETIKLLIEYGADPYIETNYGGSFVSSIDLALKHPINVLEILLNSKTNKYVKIRTLNHAIKTVKSDLYDVVELLLPHIEDINELDVCGEIREQGHSVLWNAKKHTQDEMVIELLEMHGAETF